MPRGELLPYAIFYIRRFYSLRALPDFTHRLHVAIFFARAAADVAAACHDAAPAAAVLFFHAEYEQLPLLTLADVTMPSPTMLPSRYCHAAAFDLPLDAEPPLIAVTPASIFRRRRLIFASSVTSCLPPLLPLTSYADAFIDAFAAISIFATLDYCRCCFRRSRVCCRFRCYGAQITMR